jgi:hypothetical protein
MKIAKIKTWLEVQKTVIEPMKKVRATLLNTPNESTLRSIIKTMENVGTTLTCMSAIAENKMEAQNIGVQKVLRGIKNNPIAHASEFSSLKIPENEISEQRFQLATRYFNHIIEVGAPMIELFYCTS